MIHDSDMDGSSSKQKVLGMQILDLKKITIFYPPTAMTSELYRFSNIFN
jgi:hypothetical protein